MYNLRTSDLLTLLRLEVFYKKGVLINLQNSQENTCARVSFFNKVAGLVFSCEFCEISKNTFFHRTPLVDASLLQINSKKLGLPFSFRVGHSWNQLPDHAKSYLLSTYFFKIIILF